MKYIELKVMVKESAQVNINEVAEIIKDIIYDENMGFESPVEDVTYEIKEKE